MDGQEQDKRVRRLTNQGARLLEQGKAQEAAPLFQQALEIEPQNVPALINLGGAYIMAGRHREAIAPLEAAREVEPGNAMIWINLGAAYLGNPVLATPEQQLQAIEAFQHALDLEPRAPNVHYNLGLILFDRGADDLAAAAFRQALTVDPLDRDARTWLRKLGHEEQGGGDG
jgi:tetratricopeptide (TPR) repeat protein